MSAEIKATLWTYSPNHLPLVMVLWVITVRVRSFIEEKLNVKL